MTKSKSRKTSRLRVHELSARDTKVAVLLAANALVGVFGFFESLEKGDLVGTALKKEIRKGRARARAVAKAEAEEETEAEKSHG